MNFASNTPPATDTIEVSLFGSGNGEAIAVHIGGGQWILVDSCKSSSILLPHSIAYLKSIGVDVAKDVKLIVATHWHDDHVRGVSTLVELCSNAKFVIPQALAFDEFRCIFGLGEPSYSFDNEKSGVKEMATCFNILHQRKATPNFKAPILTQSNNQLFRCDDQNCRIWALSPSALAIQNAHDEIRKMWTKIQKESQGGNGPRPPRAGIQSPERNHNAIALWISCGERKILLGADLEECGNPGLGWQAVLSSTVFPDGKASIFKIPHHGSPNGDHVPVWNNIVKDNPFACITSYNKGKTPRPAPEDISRILLHTNNLHHTGLPSKTAPIRYERTVEKTIKEVTKSRRTLDRKLGHVQIRWDVSGNISALHGGTAGIAA